MARLQTLTRLNHLMSASLDFEAVLSEIARAAGPDLGLRRDRVLGCRRGERDAGGPRVLRPGARPQFPHPQRALRRGRRWDGSPRTDSRSTCPTWTAMIAFTRSGGGPTGSAAATRSPSSSREAPGGTRVLRSAAVPRVRGDARDARELRGAGGGDPSQRLAVRLGAGGARTRRKWPTAPRASSSPI